MLLLVGTIVIVSDSPPIVAIIDFSIGNFFYACDNFYEINAIYFVVASCWKFVCA